jgi:hypothetical protein
VWVLAGDEGVCWQAYVSNKTETCTKDIRKMRFVHPAHEFEQREYRAKSEFLEIFFRQVQQLNMPIMGSSQVFLIVFLWTLQATHLDMVKQQVPVV